MSCIFCSIIEGTIPAEFVYQDENVVAFKDIDPLAHIHFVVVPKVCCQVFHETDDNTILSISHAIKHIVSEYDLSEKGYRLVNNNGTWGGQIVPHLHFHILAGEPLGHNIAGH